MRKLKKKILIVDDDPTIRDTVRLAIQEQDYLDVNVTESSDVISGIALLKTIKPDIIILDLHMQGKSGFDFLDIMHQDEELSGTKVIILTVDDTLKNIFEAEKKGVDAYYFLGKPFNISDLQSLVLRICLPISTA